ncbi:MAG TPA: preprotein translocase subunit SecE [Thermoleophilaceae bacterium]|jgi:preprotein translocase SecE subunit
MARDRQKAKQRQEQRRQERLRARGEDPGGQDGAPAPGGDGKVDADEPAEVGRLAGETGAPPENIGHSDATAESPPPHGVVDEDAIPAGDAGGDPRGRGGPDRARDLTPDEEDELFLDEEDFEVDQDELAEAEGGEVAYAPRGRRGEKSPASGEVTKAGGGARVVAFLRACWAELQRVQWPDRKQTTQLTAIVLVFIVIMGGYLGLLDAIVSRVVQEIL